MRIPRIGVIAVHGVGDHTPNETARQAAALLANLSHITGTHGAYTEFKEEPVAITVERPEGKPPDTGAGAPGVWMTTTRGVAPDDAPAAAAAPAPDAAPAAAPARWFFDERSDHLFEMHEKTGEPKPGEDGHDAYVGEFGRRFMAPLVEGVKIRSDEPPYRTVRYTSTRTSAGGGAQGGAKSHVHVYEMFWDDLSMVGTGSLAILGEFYQVLLHLPSIGRKTIDYARAADPTNFWWKARSLVQSQAARSLTIPIPILNLFLLAAFFVALPGNLSSTIKPGIAVGVLLATAACLSLYGLLRVQKLGRAWMPVTLVGMALAVLAEYLVYLHQPPWVERLLAVEWWGASVALILFGVVRPYSRLRRGALHFAILAALVTTALFVGKLWGAHDRFAVAAAGVFVAEVVFLLLLFYWSYFILCALAALALGPWTGDQRARRAALTGRISLSLSVTGLLLFSLMLYSGLNRATSNLLPPGHSYQPWLTALFKASAPLHPQDFLDTQKGQTSLADPIDQFAAVLKEEDSSSPLHESVKRLKERSDELNQILAQYAYTSGDRARLLGELNGLILKEKKGDDTDQSMSREERQMARREEFLEQPFSGYVEPLKKRDGELYLSEIADRMLSLSATPGLFVTFIAILLAGLLAVWSLLPSILSEAVAGLRGKDFAPGMGRWMSNGLRLLRVAGEINYAAVIIWLPLTSTLYLLTELGTIGPGLRRYLDLGVAGSSDAVYWMGLVIVTSAVPLLVFRGKLENLALQMRAPLQGALDVDNWLRESPEDATPRGKIAARYLSLLRSLVGKTNPDGAPYDAVVVIAHSQGTVITADLLRLLNSNREGKNGVGYVQKDQYQLSALGEDACPVYFLTVGSPLQQAYALRFPHLYAWAREEGLTTRSVPAQISATMPDPEELGLKRWVSAYRSGDYIGRHFWFNDEDPDRWTIVDAAGDPFISEQNPPGTRRERCIGSGAHVRYFDLETEGGAAIVATELNSLIEVAAA